MWEASWERNSAVIKSEVKGKASKKKKKGKKGQRGVNIK